MTTMHITNATVETERLTLRQHRVEDYDAFRLHRQDPEVYRYIGGHLSDEECWHRLMRYVGHWSLLGFGIFGVFDRHSGALLGEVGFADFHRGHGEGFDGYPEAAWNLAVAAQGKGYALEAVRAAHDWHQSQFGPQRTVCMIDPDNTPSFKLAEKLSCRVFDRRNYWNKDMVLLERVDQ